MSRLERLRYHIRWRCGSTTPWIYDRLLPGPGMAGAVAVDGLPSLVCAPNFRSCRKLPCCSTGAACWRHANSTKQPQCRRYDSQLPCHDTDEWLCPRGVGESELSASSAARVSAVEQCLRGRTLWLLGNSVNREQYFSMRRWLHYDTRDAPISVAQQKDECGGGSREP